MKDNKKIRPIVAVITTQVYDTEQRRYLSGIISEAQAFGYDTVIISNIYNPSEKTSTLHVENDIYDFIMSPDIDAFILISESILNERLRKIILEKLKLCSSKPIIAIGALLPGFILPEFIHIDTSDVDDFYDITSHLIEEHGFNDIDIITGHSNVDVSYFRVDGYRRALESHNIPYNEQKVYFGDFWMTSGAELARRYINKEIPIPQAVICANDYMAYVLLDEFFKYDIHVPEDITVVGFENVGDRLNHFPLLTTYQRNRENVGRKAVREIYSKLSGIQNVKNIDDSLSVHGTLIKGNSCFCGVSKNGLLYDIISSQAQRIQDFLNLFSQMDQKLIECVSIKEFIEVLSEFFYLNRNVSEAYICLPEKWYDDQPNEDIINCFSLIKAWDCDNSILLNKYNLADLFSYVNKPSAYYLSPLFFSDRILGYTILRYDTPDGFDRVFINWQRSISNALEFLRMKNDIRYLTQCRNISEQYDSLTGLYDISGFENAVKLVTVTAEPRQNLLFVVLKTGLFGMGIGIERQNEKIAITTEIAEALRRLAVTKNAVYGRIGEGIFACAVIGEFPECFDQLISDKLNALILHETNYVKVFGMNSYECVSRIISDPSRLNFKFELSDIISVIDEKKSIISRQRMSLQYKVFSEFRDELYLNPTQEYNLDMFCENLNIGIAHFRHLYSNFFGISYNQDCIASRILFAKYLLCTSSYDINTIAGRCGYINTKYFMRLFQKNTNLTPSQYRDRVCFN